MSKRKNIFINCADCKMAAIMKGSMPFVGKLITCGRWQSYLDFQNKRG